MPKGGPRKGTGTDQTMLTRLFLDPKEWGTGNPWVQVQGGNGGHFIPKLTCSFLDYYFSSRWFPPACFLAWFVFGTGTRSIALKLSLSRRRRVFLGSKIYLD